MITVRVLVPVIAGLPESLITIGMRYSFCCSRSNDRNDEMTAMPSPLAPSEKRNRLHNEADGAKLGVRACVRACAQRARAIRTRKNTTASYCSKSSFRERVKITLIVFHFERGPDDVVRVRVHPERERRPVAFGAVVVVGGQHLDDFPRGHVFGQHGSVVAEEFRSVVVDVLDNYREGRRGRFRRNTVVDGQNFHLQVETRTNVEQNVFGSKC